MNIKKPDDIPEREVTDYSVYLNRRNFMRVGILAATTVATGLVYKGLTGHSSEQAVVRQLGAYSPTTQPTTRGDELSDSAPPLGPDDPPTSFQDITHWNNFYEFDTDKESVAAAAAGFISRPWSVAVSGLCSNPKVFDLDDLLKIHPPQERIYRMRCVEGWSMVIPWNGFSLWRLLDRVQPLSSAKYVAFTTLLDPSRMPNQNSSILDWPYVEGLRMDEAMHPLTILASGIYGKELPPQDGAPLRLVVPWKYGFKGIKSIVKIELRDTQPPTTWSAAAPDEYGFYASVNPNVDHPRWSQATERRIGEFGKRDTLMFNGYADEVGGMYAGMDLRANF
jgi:sulfoxide reductase catalytic subunit YedY